MQKRFKWLLIIHVYWQYQNDMADTNVEDEKPSSYVCTGVYSGITTAYP